MPRPTPLRKPKYNRTKIIATMGPAISDPAVLHELVFAGLDVCRLNFSHGTHSQHQQLINLVRDTNRQLGTHLAILADLQGPKIRLGKLDEPFPITPGQHVTFSTRTDDLPPGCIPMELPTFARDVQPGDQILVNDGKEELRVVSTDGDTQVVLEVVHGKTLEARKGVNLPDSEVSVPSLTDKDRLDLELAILNDVDWVALSFVRKAEDIHQLRHILEFRGSKAKIIAKVEKPQALREIDGIIAASDAVMVARGDLGVEIPIEQVPIWQKRIVAKCNLASKPVIVATQMLDSMIENPRPTRAEATDVLNAVLDGADAVMLSGETSVGKHPLVVVETMQRIIEEAEREDSLYHRDLSFDRESPTFHSDVTCRAAVKLAEQIGATAIVGMTYSGYTAYRLSRYRPHAHIFIFTENRRLLSAMSLVWGVRAFYYDSYVGTNETIRDVNQILVEQGLIQPGDIVINTGVMPIRSRSRTNMVKFTVIE